MDFLHRPPHPVARFAVPVRPTRTGKGKQIYQRALAAAAHREFPMPIRDADVELEIAYVTSGNSATIDVDNIAKPTLDALTGIVYADGRQVRAMRLVKIDKTLPHEVAERLGPMMAIYFSGPIHGVWVWVYSASASRKRR